MTLFVNTSDSEFICCRTGKVSEFDKNLFKRDTEAFHDHFKDSKFCAVVFKDLPDIGNGFILFKTLPNPDKTLVHIRCTSQTASACQCLCMKLDISLGNSFLESAQSKAKKILKLLGVTFDSNVTKFASISSKKIKKLILKMDSDLTLNRFKFGVAYLDRFNTSEQQMLSNTIEDSSTSEAFSDFFCGLGAEICLNGWKGFAGGLDVSEECLTGHRAIYKKENDAEIIYHIAPWLPQSSNNNMNLERKRHFGNDTVVIIFSESLYAFELQTLLSRQIQVVLFVRYINRLQKYQIHIYSKLPNLLVEANPIYIEKIDSDFKLLTRLLISIERQCYQMHPFIEKLYCMRTFHLQQIINKFI